MKYATLFSLEIIHDYYTDRRCADFKIEPTPATQKLLGNHRCVLRPLPNGICVSTLLADPQTPFLPLPAQATFGFRLRLQNSAFALFTDLTAINQTAAPLYTNAASPENTDLALVSREAWFTEHFTVQQPATREPFTLSGRPLKEITTAGKFIVEGLGEIGHKRYDEDSRIIMVNTTSVSPGTPFTVTYPTEPRLGWGVFADVEIKYDQAIVKVGGDTKFQVAFKAKQTRWKYYILTDNKSSEFAIEDKDKAIIFDAAGQTDLTKSPDPTDKIAGELAKQYPNMQTFRFLSNALVPCQEAARKSIQFQLNGDKVMDALPNPALQNYVIDLKDSQQEDGLYHIVQYFTH